ncbi:MAG: beta-galactosidase [Micromonosporaceae bacterium]
MKFDRIHFGGDYNPEQWPEAVWAEDMTLMTEANVSMVTVGIFSWATVEPRPGEYDFGWFDTVMDNLARHGIRACLATMTASPPPWLARLHPETLPEREDGTRLWPGARQHYCPSSPVYRSYAGRLVEQLAARYAEHPALALWHVGNEYGCHVRACWCDVSAADFRRWLRERHGDIDTLNAAWSTTFWSQRYDSFDEVLPPRAAPTFPNPAQRLDFARFSSDAILDCYLAEQRILRRITPDVPMTTNYTGLVHKPIDSYAWATHQDVASLDAYPDPADPQAHIAAGFGYDLVRSARSGQPWMLMEQAPSAVNWREHNAPKPPGLMRLWSWQAVAHGADSVLFFQWRQSAGGAEKFHSAMLPHGGPATRVHQETRALGHELASVPELAGTRVEADVAILHDWANWWAVELDARPARIDLMQTNLACYTALYEAHVTCDVAPPTADLSRYQLVVAPNLYLLPSQTAARLSSYVAGGGHLVVGCFSGIVDGDDRVHPGGYPGPLRELLGVRVDEFWPLPGDAAIEVVFDDGQVARGTLWSEWTEPEGAEPVAVFAEGPLAGRPAVTRRPYGDGVAWYVATQLDPASLRSLFDRIRVGAGVAPVLDDLPEQVQAAVRRADGRSYLLLLNHGDEEVTAPLPAPAPDLLTDPERPIDAVTLPPRGVAVLRAS